jgi:hypothetical protein
LASRIFLRGKYLRMKGIKPQFPNGVINRAIYKPDRVSNFDQNCQLLPVSLACSVRLWGAMPPWVVEAVMNDFSYVANANIESYVANANIERFTCWKPRSTRPSGKQYKDCSQKNWPGRRRRARCQEM